MPKPKQKVTSYNLFVPIFNQNIIVLIGYRADIETWFEDKNVFTELSPNADAACLGFDGELYIWLTPKPQLSTVIHEVAHSVFNIIKTRGLDMEDEEVFCYLQEFIIEQILSCVKVTYPTLMDHI